MKQNYKMKNLKIRITKNKSFIIKNWWPLNKSISMRRDHFPSTSSRKEKPISKKSSVSSIKWTETCGLFQASTLVLWLKPLRLCMVWQVNNFNYWFLSWPTSFLKKQRAVLSPVWSFWNLLTDSWINRLKSLKISKFQMKS